MNRTRTPSALGELLTYQSLSEPLSEALEKLVNAEAQARRREEALAAQAVAQDEAAERRELAWMAWVAEQAIQAQQREAVLVARIARLEARLEALEHRRSPSETPRARSNAFSSGLGFRLITASSGASPHLATDFVLVEASSTPVGSPLGESGRCDNEPVQSVYRLPMRFAIQRAPVTRALWGGVMGQAESEGEQFKPLTGVRMVAVARFCNELSARDGLEPFYGGGGLEAHDWGRANQEAIQLRWASNGYRLPLEIEWEAAARSGSSGASGRDPAREIWSVENSSGHSQPVMMLRPNSLGLYDMLGNVRELCIPHRPGECPVSLEPRTLLSTRGGSCVWSASQCRFAARQLASRASASNDLGFRLVRTLGGHPT